MNGVYVNVGDLPVCDGVVAVCVCGVCLLSRIVICRESVVCF